MTLWGLAVHIRAALMSHTIRRLQGKGSQVLVRDAIWRRTMVVEDCRRRKNNLTISFFG